MAILLIGGALLACAAGCGGDALPVRAVSSALAAGADAREASGEPIKLYLPEASGTLAYSGKGVTIDASHTGEGYFMVKSEPNANRLKLRVTCGDEGYTYDLPSDGEFVTFPCQMGSGTYLVRIMENVEADMYAQLFAKELAVEIEDPNKPFLFPSQYVSFDASSALVAKAYLLADDETESSKITKEIYRFVVRNTDYDYDKAATVKSGYLPTPDETLESGKGICFDYSALLAAMLRARGVPTQLVIGVVMPEGISHAWNRVFMDGEWVWMDATFDGTGHEEGNYTQDRIY